MQVWEDVKSTGGDGNLTLFLGVSSLGWLLGIVVSGHVATR